MEKNEYVTSFAFGDILVNVGLDDYGQCYFMEWAEDGELKQSGCGTYNFNYKECVESAFGVPERDCPYYESNLLKDKKENCPNRLKYGYCYKCEYHDVKENAFKYLIECGILDRKGNVTEKYQNILSKKEDKNE